MLIGMERGILYYCGGERKPIVNFTHAANISNFFRLCDIYPTDYFDECDLCSNVFYKIKTSISKENCSDSSIIFSLFYPIWNSSFYRLSNSYFDSFEVD